MYDGQVKLSPNFVRNYEVDEMKKLLFLLLLLIPSLSLAEKPNPSEFTITIHVKSCYLVDRFTTSGPTVQTLNVTIEGKKYQLGSVWKKYRMGSVDAPKILPPGDYKAKIASSSTTKTGEYDRIYQVLLSDGSDREYYVIGESE